MREMQQGKRAFNDMREAKPMTAGLLMRNGINRLIHLGVQRMAKETTILKKRKQKKKTKKGKVDCS